MGFLMTFKVENFVAVNDIGDDPFRVYTQMWFGRMHIFTRGGLARGDFTFTSRQAKEVHAALGVCIEACDKYNKGIGE